MIAEYRKKDRRKNVDKKSVKVACLRRNKVICRTRCSRDKIPKLFQCRMAELLTKLDEVVTWLFKICTCFSFEFDQ